MTQSETSALVERLRQGIDQNDITDAEAAMDRAADSLERLQREVEGLRKDAERYRWLRDSPFIKPYGGPSSLRAADQIYLQHPHLTDLDKAIDAALSEGGQP